MDISQEIVNPGAGVRLSKMLSVSVHYECDYLQDSSKEFPVIRGYSIIEKLGSGADADVYLAYHNSLNLDVAIKVFRYPTWDGPRRERANRECLILEDHASHLTCIPTYREHGWLGDRMWLACDYISGLPLDIYCIENNLNLREKVELLIELCQAVQSLHDIGIHHRDLKTSNILVSDKPRHNSAGQVKLVDFGIAAIISDPSETLSIEGAPIGSLAYMSPEQAAGKHSKISALSDVYGIGATAYVILSGGYFPHVFEGDIQICLDKVINDPIRDITEINQSFPKELNLIINRALSKNQEDRFPSALHMAEDLRNWLADKPLEWTNPSYWRRAKWAYKRNPLAAVWATVAISAAVAAAFMGSYSIISAKEARLMAQADAERTLWMGKLQNTLADYIVKTKKEFKDGEIADALVTLSRLEKLVNDIADETNDPSVSILLKNTRYEIIMDAIKIVYEVNDVHRHDWYQAVGYLLESGEAES